MPRKNRAVRPTRADRLPRLNPTWAFDLHASPGTYPIDAVIREMDEAGDLDKLPSIIRLHKYHTVRYHVSHAASRAWEHSDIALVHDPRRKDTLRADARHYAAFRKRLSQFIAMLPDPESWEDDFPWLLVSNRKDGWRLDSQLKTRRSSNVLPPKNLRGKRH